MSNEQLIDMMDSHIAETTDLLREVREELPKDSLFIEKINNLIDKIYKSQFQ